MSHLTHPGHVRALVLLEGAPVELLPSAAAWTRSLGDRLEDVAARSGVAAIGEALVEQALGPGAWARAPGPARRVFTHNGGAALADLRGDWLGIGPGALAALELPVLLVAARKSPPELREPNAVMAEALPDARVVLVDGGHLIDPAADAVLTFVEDVLRDGR